MEVTAVRNERGKMPSQLAARRRFGKFAPEKEQRAREQKVETNPVLEEMKTVFRELEFRRDDHPGKSYSDARRAIEGLRYSSKDIEDFSIALAEFQDEKDFPEKAGMFLSVLINEGEEIDYVLHTKHLAVDIHDLGCRNTKNILVNGNVGESIGYWMKSGSITVNGNATNFVGWEMEDGFITIEGDVDYWVGHEMKGGCITVEGNRPHLSGQIKGGKIYHKGELIFDK